MNSASSNWDLMTGVLRGDQAAMNSLVGQRARDSAVWHLLWIVCGAGLYGAAMGYWRDPLQAGYNVIKFPLVLLLTACGNALLNGMLASLFGVPIRFRESFTAILASFSAAAMMLGAFAPITWFVVWNSPPPGSANAAGSHGFVLLVQVAAIALAGVAANLRLLGFLKTRAPEPAAAYRVLFAWLVGNLFFGSQLSWILRPFIGSPGLPVEFIRADAFNGNFYETVFASLKRVL